MSESLQKNFNDNPHRIGFDALSSLIFVVDWQADLIVYVNAATESKLASPKKSFFNTSFTDRFVEQEALLKSLHLTGDSHFSQVNQHARIKNFPGSTEPIEVFLAFSKLAVEQDLVLVELWIDENRIKSEREHRTMEMALIHKELIRNLAHEIKNPLGAIKGAAQLLSYDLKQKPDLLEYTDVIVNETLRLQQIVDKLLEPHRYANQISTVNIHEILAHVCSLILAEYPIGLKIIQDYDVSVPEFNADRGKLIQTTLNIVQNAAQALEKQIQNHTAVIKLSTRVARQVSLAQKHHKLALDLRIVDNGPGIPPELLERVFYPMFSGRKGGSGVGLTLAQTFIHQHDGWIECHSKPGLTEFRVLLPI